MVYRARTPLARHNNSTPTHHVYEVLRPPTSANSKYPEHAASQQLNSTNSPTALRHKSFSKITLHTTLIPTLNSILSDYRLSVDNMFRLQFKASQDNVSQAVSQAVVNTQLFKMDKQDRLDLGTGPTFKLKIGDNIEVCEEVPKRAAMAFSTAFNSQLAAYPKSSAFMLNPAQVTEASVTALVDFMVGNSKTLKPFSLKTNHLEFPEAINLYRHGLLLGMERYVSGLRVAILDQINDHDGLIISYAALNELVQLPIQDGIYQATVRKLEGLMHIKALDDDQEWPAWLDSHHEFALQMAAWKAIRKERVQLARAKRYEQGFPALGDKA